MRDKPHNQHSKKTPRTSAAPGRDAPGRDAPGKDASGKDAGGGREGERIAKRLARAGVASRREAETMVAAGRVSVNGKVLDSPAFNVGAADRIEIDGAPIPEVERTRLFLFHKPAGVVTTNRDPEGRRTVFDVLPKGLPRLMTVGRLDINTEGLLLLTNDGGLARVLELPATGWLRRYRVRVHGRVDPAMLEGLKEGIAVDGVYYGAVEAALDRQQGSNAWLTLGLREGKNREVRNIMEALGLEVTRLIRVSYGPFQLGPLAEGEVQEIKGRTLRDQLGERLVAEAGANFEAPVARPFTNAPARAERDRRAEPPAQSAGQSAAMKPASAHSAPAKPAPAGRERETVRAKAPPKRKVGRDEALGRLQTKPSKPGRNARSGDDRGGKADAAPRSRAANVWHAKGARPLGPKKAAEAREAGDKARPPRADRSQGAERGHGAERGKGPDRGKGADRAAAGRKADGGRSAGPRRDTRKGPGGKPGRK